MDVEVIGHTTWLLEADIGDHGGAAVLEDLVHGCAKVDRPIRHLEVLERTADLAEPDPEQRPRMAIGEEDGAVTGDHDLGHRAALECGLDVVGFAGLALLRGRPRGGKQRPALWFAAALAEDMQARVLDGEEASASRERLGL